MYPTAILPAKFVEGNSRAARIWALVRSIDHPDNGGRGTGRVVISLLEIASWLRRSERSANRYIKAALGAKFFHSVSRRPDGLLVIRYVALKKVARSLELESIGPIAEFPLEEVDKSKVKATEAMAEHLQKISFWQMKKQWKKYAAGAATAHDLLKNRLSARMSGQVISRGQRLLYLAPHWRPFGVSQSAIADSLGCSERTVTRRFSDTWRTEHQLAPLTKAQTARQIFEDLPKAELQAFCRYGAEEEVANRLVFLGKRLFLVGPNLYDTPTALRSQRWRKGEYLNVLQGKTNQKGRAGTLCSMGLSVLQEDDKMLRNC